MPAPTDDSAIFDRDLLLSFRRRAFARAEPGADFLLQRIADDLADRLDAVERRFPVAVDLAGPVRQDRPDCPHRTRQGFFARSIPGYCR